MLDIIQKGGPIMIVILGLFFIGTVIIIERLLFFRKIKVDEDKMINRLKEALRHNHYQEALSICETNPSPVTNLMRVGIDNRHLDTGTIRDMIVSAANMEVPRLERFLSSLGTIAHIAPLLGLLGTVTGNIDAFGVLGKFGSVGDPALLAAGISEALITTAAGLIVSIPTITFYNYLVNKVNHIIIRLENRVNEMVLLLGGGNAV
ncbi:MAG: MotA/TolQ/ExbB proton channel family protein [Spirochaetales bacterium]|nr:MotA/TolQ/ExbB proton channel family protein [Spirochaetales bacterium]